MTSDQILDGAIAVLRRGEVLTLDSAARESGLTKAGVVHHFPSKQRLMIAVVDRIVDRWEADLTQSVTDPEDPLSRLRAYVDYAFAGTFDASDLALLADARLRDVLRERWIDRLAPWVGPPSEGQPEGRAHRRRPDHVAARLLADGAWLNRALGIPAMDDDETSAVRRIALRLVDASGALTP